MKKTDRRIIKTKESIRKSFILLVQQKDFQSITITELAALANIDRKTFYLHYTSTYDILNEFESELADKVLFLLKDNHPFQMNSFFQELTTIMLENIDFYRHISKETSYAFLKSECKDILKNSLKESFYTTSGMTYEKFNVYSEYIASGIIGIYTDWLEKNSKMDLNDLTNVTIDALSNCWDKITNKQ